MNPAITSKYSEKMSNAIGMYRVPMTNQYVCDEGWHFCWNGVNMGRVIWTASPEGYYIEKDGE